MKRKLFMPVLCLAASLISHAQDKLPTYQAYDELCLGHKQGTYINTCFMYQDRQGVLRVGLQNKDNTDREPLVALANWPISSDAFIWNMYLGNDRTDIPYQSLILSGQNVAQNTMTKTMMITGNNYFGLNMPDGKNGIFNGDTPPARLSVYGYANSPDTAALGATVFLDNYANGGNSWYMTAGADGTNVGAHNLVFSGSQENSNKQQILTLNYDAGGRSRIGINTNRPEATLDVRGDCLMHLQKDLILGIHGDNYINPNMNAIWIGTHSNNPLELGTNDATVISIDETKHVFVGGVQKVSTDNLAKFDLFDAKGILSADYAIAPVSKWADGVFTPGYRLQSPEELAVYIRNYHHLPGIPSADSVRSDGYELHDMNVRFLQKIEELTLYAIDQDKKIGEQAAEIKVLKEKLSVVDELAVQVKALESALDARPSKNPRR